MGFGGGTPGSRTCCLRSGDAKCMAKSAVSSADPTETYLPERESVSVRVRVSVGGHKGKKRAVSSADPTETYLLLGSRFKKP